MEAVRGRKRPPKGFRTDPSWWNAEALSEGQVHESVAQFVNELVKASDEWLESERKRLEDLKLSAARRMGCISWELHRRAYLKFGHPPDPKDPYAKVRVTNPKE